MAVVNLENIGGESLEPISGLATKVWYARKTDFLLINDTKRMEDEADPTNVAASYEELMVIEADHTFKTGKCFKTIDFIQETGSIKTKPIGAKGGKLFENSVEIEMHGSDATVLGFMRAIKNDKLIVLVEEVGSGNIRQIGWSKYAAEADGLDHEIAAMLEGKNSAKITFKDKNFGPASIYKGAITVVPAT